MFLSDITVGGLENTRILRIDKGILLDRIIDERISSARVNAEFLGEHTIVQVYIITFLRVQIRVTEGYVLWVRIVYIRIQIPDTRTLDTHIISQAKLLRHTQLIRDRSVWHHVEIMGIKVHIGSHLIFHVQSGSFRTYPRLHAKLIKLHRIAQISGIDMLGMTEMAIFRSYVLPYIQRIVESGTIRITPALAEYIFCAHLQGLILPRRGRIIHLPGVLVRRSLVDIILRIAEPRIVIHDIL